MIQYIGKSEGLSLLECYYCVLLVAAHRTSIKIPSFAGSLPREQERSAKNRSASLTPHGPIFAFRSSQGFDPRICLKAFVSSFNKSVQPIGRQEGCESVEIAGGSLAKQAVKRREGELEYGKFTLKQKT